MTRSVCIAHGGDVSDPSGGSDRIIALSSGLADAGYETHIVVPAPEGNLPDKLSEVAVHPVTAESAIPGALGRADMIVREARTLAREKDAKLQLEHSALAGVGTLRGASDFILDMHDIGAARFDHVDTPVAPLLKRGVGLLERRAARSASHVIVVSDVMRDAIVGRWGIDPANVTVIPNGYFPERVRAYQGVDPAEGRVCFLGTLHPKIDLSAFEKLAEHPSVSELVIIGDGAKRNAIDRLATRFDTVRATGRLPDEEAFELLAGAEVAVNPQDQSLLQQSSSPVKLYYYAALGLPMVVAPGPSVVSHLVSRNAAVSAHGSQAVANAVGYLLENNDRREILRANALRAASTFTWSRRIDVLVNLYENLYEMSGGVA